MRNMKRLFLLRHAKSSWDDPYLEDHDRPLAPRGRKAAKRIAAYMKDEGFDPSIVLCSSAVRARQTLELVARAFPEQAAIEIEESLYHAGSGELIARLGRVPRNADSVLLIGHNPAMQDLLLTIASESEQMDSIRNKFPTAALAVLDAQIEDWDQLEPGVAVLADFITPKRLKP
jgi:phosphohistidine phosphatase